jgi:hypothetical protein
VADSDVPEIEQPALPPPPESANVNAAVVEPPVAVNESGAARVPDVPLVMLTVDWSPFATLSSNKRDAVVHTPDAA